MCGEKGGDLQRARCRYGSPPRVRGEGRPLRRTRLSAQDHPRVCGEKNPRFQSAILYTGSPPRVRGEAIPGTSNALFRRITPACAGRSSAVSRSLKTSGDHPRVCGEKDLEPGYDLESIGSPPRVRGEDCFVVIPVDYLRITPACAGRSARLLRDVFCYIGSPPRVRGEGSLSCARATILRITPACAGRRD